MPTSASFVQHSLELLSGVGPVRSRPMFGGHGLSLHGISIGIIDDDRLYLRVDDLTRPQFQEAGAQPFTYPSKKGPMVMKSYWSLPDEAVDDPDVAVKWGRLAAEASVRGEAAKRRAAPSASKASPKKVSPVKKSAPKRTRR
ncbi:MAG: TfoX/Sxy family protein [Myxococcota bacterium]|nr:TfoX/Sxy family protein [Myxococcota bacterium]